MAERGAYRHGSTTIDYRVTRSTRRKKTIQITLDPYDGVLVAAPMRASKERVQSVVRDRADWIIRKTSTSAFTRRRHEFVSGESVLYLGRWVTMTVEPTEEKRVSMRLDHQGFSVQVPFQLNGDDRGAAITSAFAEWYRRRANEQVPKIVGQWVPRIGLSPTKLLIRGQRRIWGSCAADGTIRLNWRIIMAEPTLIDYVAVHELLHLKVRNHSQDYWRKFAQVMPDYLQRRQRLNEVGPYLTIEGVMTRKTCGCALG